MPLQCCTPRMTKSSGIRERTQFCLRLPLNVKCCVLIRLLDTKQIWKAGRQKRIVSYTFFPAFLPSKESVLRRVSGNRISTELWTNHRPTLERHFPIMRAAAESIQMGEYHTLESP